MEAAAAASRRRPAPRLRGRFAATLRELGGTRRSSARGSRSEARRRRPSSAPPPARWRTRRPTARSTPLCMARRGSTCTAPRASAASRAGTRARFKRVEIERELQMFADFKIGDDAGAFRRRVHRRHAARQPLTLFRQRQPLRCRQRWLGDDEVETVDADAAALGAARMADHYWWKARAPKGRAQTPHRRRRRSATPPSRAGRSSSTRRWEERRREKQPRATQKSPAAAGRCLKLLGQRRAPRRSCPRRSMHELPVWSGGDEEDRGAGRREGDPHKRAIPVWTRGGKADATSATSDRRRFVAAQKIDMPTTLRGPLVLCPEHCLRGGARALRQPASKRRLDGARGRARRSPPTASFRPSAELTYEGTASSIEEDPSTPFCGPRSRWRVPPLLLADRRRRRRPTPR